MLTKAPRILCFGLLRNGVDRGDQHIACESRVMDAFASIVIKEQVVPEGANDRIRPRKHGFPFLSARVLDIPHLAVNFLAILEDKLQ